MEKVQVLMLFVAVAVASAAALSGSGEAKVPENMLNGSKAIFLLAGQSNMAGRGGTDLRPNRKTWDGYVPSMCKPDPRILRLNHEKHWDEAREPLHQNISFCHDSKNPSGVGPGMPFANTLLAIHPAIGTIGLVPCAIGDTDISQWRRGGCLYDKLLTRARASLRHGGSLRAMLWYQGENDSKAPESADAYEDRLKAFFNDIRNDLMMPLLPIIQVALDLPESDHNVKKVRRAQLKLNLPNLRTVDALGLPLIKGDQYHLATDSQVTLGSKLAREFVEHFI